MGCIMEDASSAHQIKKSVIKFVPPKIVYNSKEIFAINVFQVMGLSKENAKFVGNMKKPIICIVLQRTVKGLSIINAFNALKVLDSKIMSAFNAVSTKKLLIKFAGPRTVKLTIIQMFVSSVSKEIMKTEMGIVLLAMKTSN